MAFLKNRAAAILLGVSALFLPHLGFAQDGLENNELQRNINRASEDLRQMIAQQQFQAASTKADELLTLDPNNSAAIIWKDYANQQLSGPEDSRLKKLLGDNLSLSRETIRNEDDAGPIRVASAPPPVPRPDPTTPSDNTGAGNPSTQSPSSDNPFNNDTPALSNESSDAAAQSSPAPVTIDPTPAATVAPVANSSEDSSSSSGTNWIMIAAIVVGGVVLLGLIFLILGRRKSKDEDAEQTGGANRHDLSDKPTSPISDAVTGAPAPDNITDTLPDQVTQVDPRTEADELTRSDQDTAQPEADTLYEALGTDEQVETTPELSFGALNLDDADEDDTQKSASQSGSESFSDVMFAKEEETKPPQKQNEEEIDPNEMSFNSMMFGGAEDETRTPPPSADHQKKSKEDSINLDSFEENQNDNDNTFSSVMFDEGEETVAPGMESGSASNQNDQSQGGESFSDVMFDQNDETVAPPGIGSSGPESISEQDTMMEPNLSDTRKIEKPNDDDDDSIKL